jgi:hypothetical protein
LGGGFFLQIGEMFPEKQEKQEKKKKEKIFSPFLEIKIIKLATSRRRHFLGRHM